MEELKPCPLCGGEVSIALCGDDVEHYFMVTRGLVRTADSCRCRLFLESRKFTDMDEADVVRQELVDTWNTRAEQTCVVTPDGYGNGVCSNCQEELEIYDGWSPIDNEFLNLYCPNCGAKVVS